MVQQWLLTLNRQTSCLCLLPKKYFILYRELVYFIDKNGQKLNDQFAVIECILSRF